MKTVTIQAYPFDELSDRAKEKAREWLRRTNNGDLEWSETTIDEAVREGELMGITFKERQVPLHGGGTRGKPCIWWTGFSSQGDGACFEGEWRAGSGDLSKVADGWGDDASTTEIKRIAGEFAAVAGLFPHASFTVDHHGSYYHEHSTEFTFNLVPDNDGDNQDTPEGVVDAAEGQLAEAARDFMRWIYRQLNAAYDDYNSDETVDETIRHNEYLFTEEGSRTAVLD